MHSASSQSRLRLNWKWDRGSKRSVSWLGSLNRRKRTFLGGLDSVVPFAFLLVLTVALDFSKVGPFVVRSEVYCQFGVVTGCFLLVLLHAPLYYHIHVFVSISLLVDLLASLELLECWVIEDFPAFFWVRQQVPLFRMIKNLLKQSIFYNLSIFLFPEGSLYSSLIALMFSKDCISILLRISLTEGISMGGFSFKRFS